MKMAEGLRYSKDHEWVRPEGTKAYIGITNYAQLALGDIVYVELPKPGAFMKAGGALGVVESVKAASDIYCPITGTVVEINQALADAPEKINQEPYESWFVAVEIANAAEIDGLMDEAAYGEFCAKEG